MAEGKDAQAPAETDEAPQDEIIAPGDYTVTRLTEDSYRFFGVESHVAAGAFHELSGEDVITREEGQKLIDSFAKRKVEG